MYTATVAGYDEDIFEDLLSPAGTQFRGDALDTEESLTPLSESMITIQGLKSIHPDLPKHIKERHAHLFSQSKPNWVDLQPDFVKQMDTLLAEVEASEGDDIRVGRLGLQPEEMVDIEAVVVIEEAVDVELNQGGELDKEAQVVLFRVDIAISVMQLVNLRVL